MYEEKIEELGYKLPEAPKPLAAYVPALLVNKFVFTAGQVPVKNGELIYSGKLGKDLTVQEGIKAAEISILNCLSAVKSVAGSLDNIEKIVKVTVFVNSADGFTEQPKVANGASELLVKIFGENGKHTRSAVGVNELPINASVEIEIIVKIK